MEKKRQNPERTLGFYYMIGKYDYPTEKVVCKAEYKQISGICIQYVPQTCVKTCLFLSLFYPSLNPTIHSEDRDRITE